jgi:hypothetical protein
MVIGAFVRGLSMRDISSTPFRPTTSSCVVCLASVFHESSFLI